ncbi:hypothetical protein BS50DRAFT_665176, partial [Corynespora cassiicola Philippines]
SITPFPHHSFSPQRLFRVTPLPHLCFNFLEPHTHPEDTSPFSTMTSPLSRGLRRSHSWSHSLLSGHSAVDLSLPSPLYRKSVTWGPDVPRALDSSEDVVADDTPLEISPPTGTPSPLLRSITPPALGLLRSLSRRSTDRTSFLVTPTEIGTPSIAPSHTSHDYVTRILAKYLADDIEEELRKVEEYHTMANIYNQPEHTFDWLKDGPKVAMSVFHRFVAAFRNNPYGVHPGIYIFLHFASFFAIVYKILKLSNFVPRAQSELENPEAFLRDLGDVGSQFITFTLFLFPPMLANLDDYWVPRDNFPHQEHRKRRRVERRRMALRRDSRPERFWL